MMKEHSVERELFEDSPILTSILRLAAPTVLGQIILVIYNMADTFFIGMTGDDAMLTAVTVCMPAFLFLSAISNLFGVGGASAVSRALGARDPERAGTASAFCFWGCLLTSALYALGAWLLADRFIDLLGGADPSVHAFARSYLRITVVMGGGFAAMSTFLAHLLRAEGHSVQASAGVIAGGLLNIALDPLFMFALLPDGQEVAGAAIATALSNLISLIYFACALRRNRSGSALRFRPVRAMFAAGVPAEVLSCGLPACLMTLFENISYAVLDHLMAFNGVTMQAGIGVAKKINMLAHCIVRGMAQGVLPLISYNYASGNRRRMRQAVLLSTGISVGLAAACTLACLSLSEPLVGLFFRGDTESLKYGARFLRILCLGGPFSACAYAAISFFQAVGRGMRSFLLAILRKGVLDIPLMFMLRTFDPACGIVWATPVADLCCCAAAVCLLGAFLRREADPNGRRARLREEGFGRDRSQAVFPAGSR